MNIAEQLFHQYNKHLHRCTPCAYADIYVSGCTIGRGIYREYEAAMEEHFLDQELKGARA